MTRKEIKHSNGKRWTARCPECNAWHVIKVLVRAELTINPGSTVKARWDDDTIDIVCGECLQDVSFLLDDAQKQSVLELAYRTF